MNADEAKTRSYFAAVCRVLKACAVEESLLTETGGLNEVNRAITSIPKVGADPDLTVWAARVSSWAMRKSVLLERQPTGVGRFLGGVFQGLLGVRDTASEQFDQNLARIGNEWEAIIGDFEPLMAVLSSRYGEGFGYADD